MLTLKAYAKINLGLRILRQRDDGYHELETVFHRINLFDEVTLEPAETLSLRCEPERYHTDERNLSYRAALFLRRYLGRDDGASIRLRKNIPAGAGLGGGSSDAAATLLGLIRLWRVEIPSDRLLSIALQLGSDVPYFLNEGSAYATGRGEILDYFHLRVPHWIVVVYPNLPVSTAWAYRQLRATTPAQGDAGRPRSSLKDAVQNELNHPGRLQDSLYNDFEPLVFSEHKPALRVKRALDDAGASLSHLSGSGSSVYGFFPGEQQARAAASGFDSDCITSITPAMFEPELEPVVQ